MRKMVAAFVAVCLTWPAMGLAKSPYNELCEDPANGALALPADPRALTADHRYDPQTRRGYTSVWDDCHPAANPKLTATRPASCDEWVASKAHGQNVLERQGLIGGFIGEKTWNDLWKAWGVSDRPADFDQRVLQRYGFQPAPFDNPYRTASGDTGQLPMGFVAIDGGQISITCLLCHAGRIGTPSDVGVRRRLDVDANGGAVLTSVRSIPLGSWIGLGDNTFDFDVLSYDLGKAGGTPIPLPYPHNESRGSIDAVEDFEFLMTVRDFDTLDLTPFVKTLPAHASPGDQDPPNWWNTGMRPRVYMDGGVSADNTRALMQFLTANVSGEGQKGSWIKAQEGLFEDIRSFVDSVEPPPYPGAIDPTLALQGEAVFHTKTLFPSTPAPFANGSCSSCHGVYSPRYAANLPGGDPRLLGIAGQIVPKAVIQTDPSRVDALSSDLRWGWGTLWFAYPDFMPDYREPASKTPLEEILDDYYLEASNDVAQQLGYGRVQGPCAWEQRQIGYAAPPLHGIWASAPYFHNGSVPTVRQVLRPAERPAFWRRQLMPCEDCGYETDLSAYDFDRLGWRNDAIDCAGLPLPACAAVKGFAGSALNVPGSQVWLANQSPRPLTQQDVETRKIYDTTRYGKSNHGHEFAATLSEGEVRAVIEYLKTL